MNEPTREAARAAAREKWRQDPHEFKCPQCFRCIDLVYRPERPLPTCVGGPAPHMPTLLISSDFDEAQAMAARALESGDAYLKPLIHTRNYWRFPVRPPGESIRDFGVPVFRQ